MTYGIAVRRSLILLAVSAVLVALPACQRQEEPVANKFARQQAEIENKAEALQREVDNDVSAVESQLENEGDAVTRNQAAGNMTAAAENSSR
jgi:hypothetical protein